MTLVPSAALIFNLACTGYVILVGLLLYLSGRPGVLKHNRFPDAAFLVLSFAVVFVRRFPIFRYDLAINPDEALFAANALRSTYGWVTWGAIDPTTSGPLNSIVLTWPYLFGGDITLYSGRLTATVLACGTIAILFAIGRKLTSFVWTAAAIAPCVLFYAATAHYDFVHFSSEQVPVFLIALGCLLLVYSVQKSSIGYALAAAFVAGLLPFAKLQGLPFSVLLGVSALASALRVPDSRLPLSWRMVAVAAAGILPAVIFLLPVAASGNFDDFLKSYFVQQWLRSRDAPGVSLYGMMMSVPTFAGLVQTAFGLALLSGGAFLASNNRKPLTDVQIYALYFSIAVLAASYIAIVTPNRPYLHYLLFALPALALIMIVSGFVLKSIQLSNSQATIVTVVAFVVSVSPILASLGTQQPFLDQLLRAEFRTGRAFVAPRPLAWLGVKRDDTVVCWGWRPECYVDNAMRSGTRDGTNEVQLYPLALQPYFRSRFMADFRISVPDFVLDFVAPGSGPFVRPEVRGIPSFPEFMSAVRSDFQMVSRVSPVDRCPRLYVRNDRIDKIGKSLVEFESISGPAEPDHGPHAVDDRSIFETCDDFWLLPKRELGALSIAFRQPAAVRRVAILNTRNGSLGDRATERVRLTVLDQGRAVAMKDIELDRFPRWTMVAFDPPLVRADAITIDVLSFRGEGGGLNEVKVYSDERLFAE